MKGLSKEEQVLMPGISTTLFMKHLRHQIAAELVSHGFEIDRAADTRQHFVVFKSEYNSSNSSSTSCSSPGSRIGVTPMGLPPLPRT